MRNRSARSAGPVAALLAVALLAVGCGGSDDTTSASTDNTTGGATATTKEPALSATLNAAGATFPKGFYEVAIAGYKKAQPGVTVNYNANGSGAGRQSLQDGVVDFAGSDGLVAAADVSNYKGEFL